MLLDPLTSGMSIDASEFVVGPEQWAVGHIDYSRSHVVTRSRSSTTPTTISTCMILRRREQGYTLYQVVRYVHPDRLDNSYRTGPTIPMDDTNR
ncbi:hypothetical protein WA026_003008 [Henosepilachna vigintioctopunctata]|uniref:Uncharacterized protein n=1 Tax=Henosepilachna vigintioctopunctata TaxID=420089 RepID=A0AAW1TLY8_9CUCU